MLITADVMHELCDTKFSLKLNLYEPFEEYVKQVEVKPLDNVPAKVKKDINADVIGYRLFE